MFAPLLALPVLLITTVIAPGPGTPFIPPSIPSSISPQSHGSVSYNTNHHQYSSGSRAPPQHRATIPGGQVQQPPYHVGYYPGYQDQGPRQSSRHPQRFQIVPNWSCPERTTPFLGGPNIQCQCRETENIVKTPKRGLDCFNTGSWAGFNYHGGCFEPHFMPDSLWNERARFFLSIDGDCFVPRRIAQEIPPTNGIQGYRPWNNARYNGGPGCQPSDSVSFRFLGPEECACHENEHIYMVLGVTAAQCLRSRRSTSFRHRFGCFDKGDGMHKAEEFLRDRRYSNNGGEACFYWRHYQ